MQRNTYQKILQLLVIGAVLALVVVYFSTVMNTCSFVFSLLKPLLLGLAIAYLVDIPAKKLEVRFRKRIKSPMVARSLATLISLCLFLLIIAGVLVLLIPQLGFAIRQFSSNLPVLYEESAESLEQFVSRRPELAQGFAMVETYVNTAIEEFKASSTKLADYTFTVLGGAISGIATSVVALIFSLYLLFGKHRLVRQLDYLAKRFMPEQYYQKLFATMQVANRTFSKFLPVSSLKPLFWEHCALWECCFFDFPMPSPLVR